MKRTVGITWSTLRGRSYLKRFDLSHETSYFNIRIWKHDMDLFWILFGCERMPVNREIVNGVKSRVYKQKRKWRLFNRTK